MKKIEELIIELEMAIERDEVTAINYYLAQAKNELANLCKMKDKESKQLFATNIVKLGNLERYLFN